jgi:hypothetical protein
MASWVLEPWPAACTPSVKACTCASAVFALAWGWGWGWGWGCAALLALGPGALAGGGLLAAAEAWEVASEVSTCGGMGGGGVAVQAAQLQAQLVGRGQACAQG